MSAGTKAFAAAIAIKGRLYIDVSSTRRNASTVRHDFGGSYSNNWQEGWDFAKKRGWRVVAVIVSPVQLTSDPS